MFPSPNAPHTSIARQVPEGTIPLIAVEGTAYECGFQYGELVRAQYASKRASAGGDRYDPAWRWWTGLPADLERLMERTVPHLPD